MSSAGSQLYVQTDAKLFCLEKRPALNSTGGALGFDYCPKWAGGDGSESPPPPPDPEAPPPGLDSNWILVNDGMTGKYRGLLVQIPIYRTPRSPQVNYTKASSNSITVDLAPLNGATAVRGTRSPQKPFLGSEKYSPSIGLCYATMFLGLQLTFLWRPNRARRCRSNRGAVRVGRRGLLRSLRFGPGMTRRCLQLGLCRPRSHTFGQYPRLGSTESD